MFQEPVRWRQPGRGRRGNGSSCSARSRARSTVLGYVHAAMPFQGPRRRLHFAGDTTPPTLEHQHRRRLLQDPLVGAGRVRSPPARVPAHSSRASASVTAATAASSVAAPLRASTTIQRSANTDAGAAPANFCTCVVVTDPSPLRALHWIATRDLSRLTATRSMPASWDGRGSLPSSATATLGRYFCADP